MCSSFFESSILAPVSPFLSPQRWFLSSTATYSCLFFLSSVIISAGKTPDGQFTFNALNFYQRNQSIFGLNTGLISLRDAVTVLARLKPAFEAGELHAPPNIEEVDLAEEKAVLAAYKKVEGGAKSKQVLVNKNI